VDSIRLSLFHKYYMNAGTRIILAATCDSNQIQEKVNEMNELSIADIFVPQFYFADPNKPHTSTSLSLVTRITPLRGAMGDFHSAAHSTPQKF
jgi:hypothetical protein